MLYRRNIMNVFYNNKILFVINVKHTDMDLLLKQLKVLLQEREEEFIWDKEKNTLRMSQPYLF